MSKVSKADRIKVVARLLGERVCPKCNKKIDSLLYFSKVEVSQDFDLDNGEPNYGSMEDFGDHTDDHYACPECFETICTEEEDAVQFMKRPG